MLEDATTHAERILGKVEDVSNKQAYADGKAGGALPLAPSSLQIEKLQTCRCIPQMQHTYESSLALMGLRS